MGRGEKGCLLVSFLKTDNRRTLLPCCETPLGLRAADRREGDCALPILIADWVTAASAVVAVWGAAEVRQGEPPQIESSSHRPHAQLCDSGACTCPCDR